jgi:hypothetical protein
VNDSKEPKRPGHVEKDLTYVRCPIHRVEYPKGGQCPVCAADKKRK